MSYHDFQLIKTIADAKSIGLCEERILRNYMPLVRKLAWHVHNQISSAIEIEDLMQIGSLALVEAFRAFEDRGLGFGNYAKLRIRGAIIDELRKQSCLSRSALEFRKNLRAAESSLSQQLGGAGDEFSLAREMGMDLQRFRAAIDNAQAMDLKSIDEVYSDHNICFEVKGPGADQIIEEQQKRQSVALAILGLPDREAMILRLYFVEEMNLGKIGEVLGIGAARVCQIKNATLKKLKPVLANLE